MTVSSPPPPVHDADSTDRFGYEWDRYHALDPAYEEQFRRWTPFLQPEDWRGSRFLDVGCGMGRNSVWPMRYGAAGGVAIDVDPRTLAAARRTLAPFPSVEVQRLNVHDLGADAGFDIAFAIGVIHHLRDPHSALARMAAAVKPGGRVLVWVYGRERIGIFVRLLSPLRRLVFSRLPVGVTHALSWAPAALLWLLLRLGFGRLEYFQLIRRFRFDHLRSIVFDQMLPRIAHYWSQAEVEALLRGAGLNDVRVTAVNGLSWAAIGRRADTSPP